MLIQLLFFFFGLIVLYFGAEWLVRGASSLALKFGIRPMVVGLTVVALGTSMPEFLINFFAAMWEEDSLALGNIVGSNIANIALILGVSALVFPLIVSPGTLRKEYPIMMLVMGLFYLLSLDGVINQIDGLILVVCLIGLFLYLVNDTRRHNSKSALKNLEEVTPKKVYTNWQKALFVFGGMFGLAIGARIMVSSAVYIANGMGIDHLVIGLTVVAIGTSLPELAASVVCAIKKEADMSVGNVLGSNMLNVLFVVGLVSLIRPLEVEPSTLSIHFPVMMGFGALLLPLAWTQYRITRLEGGVLLASFLGYMAYLVFPYV